MLQPDLVYAVRFEPRRRQCTAAWPRQTVGQAARFVAGCAESALCFPFALDEKKRIKAFVTDAAALLPRGERSVDQYTL